MIKRIVCLLLACALLGGCGASGEKALRSNELLAVGDTVCTWAEAQIYILSQYTKYTGAYGPGIWAVEMEEGSFETYIKEGLLDYLKLLFLADYGAARQNVRLSEAEQASVNRAAAAFMEALGQEGRNATGITEETLRAAYARYGRAQIFYRQIQVNGQTEISDEEARIIRLEIIEAEQRVGLVPMKQFKAELEQGGSIAEVVQDLEGVRIRRENISRGDLPGELESIAFALKEGEWSPIITQGTSYFLLHCLSPYEEEKTAIHKAEMERELRDRNLKDTLKELASSVQLIYNPRLWDSWTMEKWASLPPVNFYDYARELEK